jgi:uncharacterized protein (TIRG00374 family)
MKSFKRKITIILGIPISIIFLYLATRKVDFQQTLQIIKQTNYLYLLPALLAFMADFSTRALRWKVLLTPLKKCKYSNLVSNVFLGFFGNTVLPMRAGEIIRILMLREKENISKASSVATIIIERAMDIFAILLLLSITFFIFPYPASINKLLFLCIAIFVFVIIVFYGIMFYRDKTLAIMQRFLNIFPHKIHDKLEHFLDSFISGLEILRNTQHLLTTAALSIIVWLFNASVLFFVAKGMGISQINYMGAIFIMSVIAIGVSVPSSPGFVGVFEYFGILACTILGVSKSVSLSFVLLAHTLQMAMMTIGGMIFLAREHVSLIQLEKKAEQED